MVDRDGDAEAGEPVEDVLPDGGGVNPDDGLNLDFDLDAMRQALGEDVQAAQAVIPDEEEVYELRMKGLEGLYRELTTKKERLGKEYSRLSERKTVLSKEIRELERLRDEARQAVDKINEESEAKIDILEDGAKEELRKRRSALEEKIGQIIGRLERDRAELDEISRRLDGIGTPDGEGELGQATKHLDTDEMKEAAKYFEQEGLRKAAQALAEKMRGVDKVDKNKLQEATKLRSKALEKNKSQPIPPLVLDSEGKAVANPDHSAGNLVEEAYEGMLNQLLGDLRPFVKIIEAGKIEVDNFGKLKRLQDEAIALGIIQFNRSRLEPRPDIPKTIKDLPLGEIARVLPGFLGKAWDELRERKGGESKALLKELEEMRVVEGEAPGREGAPKKQQKIGFGKVEKGRIKILVVVSSGRNGDWVKHEKFSGEYPVSKDEKVLLGRDTPHWLKKAYKEMKG